MYILISYTLIIIMPYYYRDYNYTSVLWKMKGNKSYIKNPTKCEKEGIIMGMTKKKTRQDSDGI